MSGRILDGQLFIGQLLQRGADRSAADIQRCTELFLRERRAGRQMVFQNLFPDRLVRLLF